MANLSLVLLVVVLALAASSNANSFGPHRRDHADLGRMLKKRAPVDILGGQPSAQGQQTPSASQSAQPTPATSAVAQSAPVSAQTTPEAPSSAAANPSTANGGLLGTIVGGLLPTESSTTSSVGSTTAPSTSSHTSTNPQTSAEASKTPSVTPTQSILYLTTGPSSTPTPTQTSSSSSSSGMSHAAMTVLVVIAASVGASVIVWTIIRKWKFRPSSDFEGRMQPIDWQPGENDGLSGQHRPLSRTSSFHSGSGQAQADDQMRCVGGYGASPLAPIPDHDFTAGPAHLAPIGGYADLARGPSPQPVMQESLGRVPSANKPVQYDQYGVPLHHGYSGY